METIKWVNKKGYTLLLTWEEIESLYALLKIAKREHSLPQDNQHFRIEEVI